MQKAESTCRPVLEFSQLSDAFRPRSINPDPAFLPTSSDSGDETRHDVRNRRCTSISRVLPPSSEGAKSRGDGVRKRGSQGYTRGTAGRGGGRCFSRWWSSPGSPDSESCRAVRRRRGASRLCRAPACAPRLRDGRAFCATCRSRLLKARFTCPSATPAALVADVCAGRAGGEALPGGATSGSGWDGRGVRGLG